MKRLKRFWYAPWAILMVLLLTAASPMLSETFSDWIMIEGTTPMIYLDHSSDTSYSGGGLKWRDFADNVDFWAGCLGSDTNFEVFSIRVGDYDGTLGLYIDAEGDVGAGRVPTSGYEFDVDGDTKTTGDMYVGDDLTVVGQVQAEHLKSTDDVEVADDLDVTGDAVITGTLDVGADGIHGGYIAEFDGSVYVDDNMMVLGYVDSTLKTHLIGWDSSVHHPYIAFEGPTGSYSLVIEDWDGGDNQSETVVHQQMMIDAYNFGDADPEDPDIVFTDDEVETWRIGVNRSDDTFVISPYGETANNFTERFALVIEEDYVEIGDRAQANDDGAVTAANGYFAADGDAQGEGYIMRRAVTFSDATWHDLYLDGSANVLNVPTDSAWTFEALVTVTTSGCGESAGYKIVGLIENDGGTTTLHYGPVVTLYEDDVSWDVRVVGNDTDDSLEIEIQDADSGGDTIRAVAIVGIAEVTYP